MSHQQKSACVSSVFMLLQIEMASLTGKIVLRPLFSPPGRLLDATHQYMYVFLLAGCEVTLSAIVLTLGNLFCIRKKQEEGNETEKKGLNHRVEREERNGKGVEGPEDRVGAANPGELMMLMEMGTGENTSL